MSALPVPCHFGHNGELFGMYHAAAFPPRTAMLLCPPLGQSLIRSHRIYRQLANALATQGIAALRFDYYGSGDSAGEATAVDWHRCLADIKTAATELRARTGCDRVIGFGAQLGGSLALASAVDARFAQVILWDPVVDGGDHVAALDRLQETLRVDPLHYAQPRAPHETGGQWLGFAISERWRQQLMAFRAEWIPSTSVHILDSSPPGQNSSWERLVRGGATLSAVQPPIQWDDLHRLEHTILAPGLIQAVCGRMGEAA